MKKVMNKIKDANYTKNEKKYFTAVDQETDPLIKSLCSQFGIGEIFGDYRMYKGYVKYSEDFFGKLYKVLKLGNFRKITEFCTRYRYVMSNRNKKTIFTYCEGDIWMRVFNKIENYKKFIETMKENYNN